MKTRMLRGSHMAIKISGDGRFQWGINIDDMWRYAGLAPPKSVAIPYLLSTRSHAGNFTVPLHHNERNSSNDETSSKTPDADDSNNLDTGRLAGVLATFLRKQGVNFVRCWFPWNFFEWNMTHRSSARQVQSSASLDQSASSRYRFPLDDFVSKMHESGIGIIAVLGNGYSRFLPSGLKTNDLKEYVQRLTESSTQILRHYKDKIKVWQIENEPNWWRAHYSIQWRNGRIWLEAKSQETILAALHDAVRSECPDATVIINLEADSKRFRFARFFPRLTAPMNWKLYAKYCDVIGLDFYPNYYRSDPIDASLLTRTAQEVKKETGSPIFVIETGYPTGPRPFGFSEEKQSRYIRSACEEAFSCDAITGLGWFRLSDSYWKSFPFPENHFGLLTKKGGPKLGWSEYANQIKQRR